MRISPRRPASHERFIARPACHPRNIGTVGSSERDKSVRFYLQLVGCSRQDGPSPCQTVVGSWLGLHKIERRVPALRPLLAAVPTTRRRQEARAAQTSASMGKTEPRPNAVVPAPIFPLFRPSSISVGWQEERQYDSARPQ